MRAVEARPARPLPTRLLVVGDGPASAARELGYGSDADVLFVHDPLPGRRRARRRRQAAHAVVKELRRLLGAAGPDPPLGLDADLRPEGKNGPLVRTLASYRAYYERWSLVWEAQALLRADAGRRRRRARPGVPRADRPAALARAAGLTASTTCARSARSRRGWRPSGCPAAPTRKPHLKLGPRRAVRRRVDRAAAAAAARATRCPALRTTAHPGGARRGAARPACSRRRRRRRPRRRVALASRLRNAAVLWRGRPVDGVPSDLRDADGIGRIVGREPGTGAALAEDYRRLARRARAAVVSTSTSRPRTVTSARWTPRGPKRERTRSCRRTHRFSACARSSPIFVANALSAWGDHLARLTVAGVRPGPVGLALAAATTLAVSLVPSLFGRSLLGPIADRFPYRDVLIAANVVRAALRRRSSSSRSPAAGPSVGCCRCCSCLELAGGPGRHVDADPAHGPVRGPPALHPRDGPEHGLSEQVNQVIGLGIGGVVVFAVGATNALWFDLATFLLGAVVVALTIRHRPVVGTPSAGLVGYFRDIVAGGRYLAHHRVLAAMLALGLATSWAIAAPEAVALAYAAEAGEARYGGLLMAAPMAGRWSACWCWAGGSRGTRTGGSSPWRS